MLSACSGRSATERAANSQQAKQQQQPRTATASSCQLLHRDLLAAQSCSSDNLETSCASSSGKSSTSSGHSCSSETRAFLRPAPSTRRLSADKRAKTSQRSVAGGSLVAPEGVLYKLAATNQQPLNHQAHRCGTVSSSPRPPSSSPPPTRQSCSVLRDDQTGANNSSRRQEQHRKLQFQVHQQLQRIYGNKLQEFERQQNQLQARRAAAAAATNQQFQQPEQQPVGTSGSQSRRSYSASASCANMQAAHMCHHLAASSSTNNVVPINRQQPNSLVAPSYQEQTYDDLLSQPSLVADSVQDVQSRMHLMAEESYYSLQQRATSGGAGICRTIPEECLVDENNNNNSHNHNDDEEDEEELLIPQQPVRQQQQQRIGDNNQQSASARKNAHLESLQYATATAAALLNVTANAAAAFAASEKQTPPTRRLGAGGQLAAQNNVYSTAAYREAEVVRQRPLVYQPRQQQQQPTSRGEQVPQQQLRGHIYATASDNYNLLGESNLMARGRLRPPPPKPVYLPGRGIIPRGQPQQQQVYNLNQSDTYQHYSLANNNNFNDAVQATRPPLPQTNALSGQQLEMLRQQKLLYQQHQRQLISHHRYVQQQQQQLQRTSLQAQPALGLVGNGAPALALLHNGKGAGAAAALKINMLQPPQPLRPATISLNSSSRCATIGTDPLTSGRTSGAKLLEGAQALAYGVLAVRGKSQQLCGPKTRQFIPVQAIATNAPSDVSNHSNNLPLILDRQLKQVGCLERICQINLTLFWWCLLALSLVFISVVLTISRYVF